MLQARFVAVALVLLTAAPVFADEKVVVLKNGRRIQGELIQDSDAGVSVRSAGGTITVKREDVARIEDPPKESEFLKPEKTDKKPDPTKKPDAPAEAEKPFFASTAVIYTGASAAVLNECRAFLKRAETAPDGQIDGIFDTGLTRFGIEAYVTMIVRRTEDDDRVQVRRALMRAGDRARRQLIEALRAYPNCQDLPAILDPIFDRSVEDAFVGLLPQLKDDGQQPVVDSLGRRSCLPDVLGRRATAAAVKPIMSIVLTSKNEYVANNAADSCCAIIRRDEDPSALVRPYVPQLEKVDIEDASKVLAAVTILSAAPEVGRFYVDRIVHDVERKLRTLKENDARRGPYQGARYVGYKCAVSVGSLDDAKTAVETEENSGVRVELLRCFSSAQKSSDDPKLLAWVVGYLEKPDTSKAAEEVLGTLTGLPFGKNVAAWKSHIQKLTAAQK